MAKIKHLGPGRKTSGTFDGVTYVTMRNGETYIRATPAVPNRALKTPAARKRQAIFKLIQMHQRYHLRTIRQTFTPKGTGTPSNRYFSTNYKALAAALDTLADQYVAGEVVTLSDVEAAISAYATANPQAIVIAKKSGYGEVYLTGAWPDTITLYANGGDSTVIIVVGENGTSTTISHEASANGKPSVTLK